MTSINPSFGNNLNKNINANLNKSNTQAKQTETSQQFNVGSLNAQEGDSVNFSTKHGKGNEPTAAGEDKNIIIDFAKFLAKLLR